MPRPRVLILGAGFGGLWAARKLAGWEAEVRLVDRNNYHTFLPLLYQVAAAEVGPEDIVYPVRSIVRGLPNVEFIMGDVRSINFAARELETSAGAWSYDYLILAAGSTTHYFGVPGAAENAFPLKTLDEGIRLRNHILCCFEQAVQEASAERRREMLTFVIVGGGPTGVEFAGALAELLRRPLRRDFRKLDFSAARVVLLEGGPRLLPALPPRLGAYVERRLRRMEVDVRLGATVTAVSSIAVEMKEGGRIATETVVWTAGVRGVLSASAWGLPTGRDGRVPVLPTLQVPDHPEVYVVGDLASINGGSAPLPMIAPVAIQQGVTAAENIRRSIAGEPQRDFHYRDRGTMATIGRNAAVADLGGRTFTGFPAWILWLGVHLMNLIGFRNRLIVLINWAWDYFLYERAVRLILPSRPCAPASPQPTPARETKSGVLRSR